MNLDGLAAELDALSHRALKLPAGSRNPEAMFVARQELARAIARLAGKVRQAAAPAPAKPVKASPGPIVPGVVVDRYRNVIKVDVRKSRRPKP